MIERQTAREIRGDERDEHLHQRSICLQPNLQEARHQKLQAHDMVGYQRLWDASNADNEKSHQGNERRIGC